MEQDVFVKLTNAPVKVVKFVFWRQKHMSPPVLSVEEFQSSCTYSYLWGVLVKILQSDITPQKIGIKISW